MKPHTHPMPSLLEITPRLLARSSHHLNPLQRLRRFFMRSINSNDSPCAHALTRNQSPHQLLTGFDRLVVMMKEFVDFENSHLDRSGVCGTCGKVALDFVRAKRDSGSRIHRVLIINDPELRSWQDLKGRDMEDYKVANIFILNGEVQKNRFGPVGYSVREEESRP